MNNSKFIEEIFEIAFGADAFPYEGDDLVVRGFSRQECIDKIREFSDDALRYQEEL